MNILAELRSRFAAALRGLVDDERVVGELAGLVLPSQDAKFGDYQANMAMALGKRLSKPPREVAAAIVERLEVADLCEAPEVAGPGFINLRLRDAWVAGVLKHASPDVERVGVEATRAPRTYVLDYSSPNVAKPMHVGHIRSTVIGDALYRVLKFLGHRTISDNHIGDWGTQFGMIIYGWKHWRDEEAFARAPVVELTRLYRRVNGLVEYFATRDEAIPAMQARISECERRVTEVEISPRAADANEQKKQAKQIRQAEGALAEARADMAQLQAKLVEAEGDDEFMRRIKEHEGIGAAVLAETAALHAGDPTNRALWEKILPPCLKEIDETYARLGVSFDHTLGESFYEDKLGKVVADLKAKGLARESDGAMCVFVERYEAPFIVQKQDGAFLYATTDLATIQYRMREWCPDAILYVVDHRQSQHFGQLFATARLWGYDKVELQHISFGTVLGDDGKPFKTRSGSSVGLTGLLDEAVERAYKIVCENDDARPEALLSPEERRTVAERVGIGAIKYADLAHNRTSDYKFSYDKMLAMTGNTAAYMQYSYARVSSIFGKANAEFGLRVADLRQSAIRNPQSAISLDHPAERALGLAILQFSEALDRVVADYRPNLLTDYLFELAGKYSAFFENCPVLKAETEELRNSRLLLCDLTARTLQRGLNLLGIEVVERM
jgi:arginyl-tRNA synthetase